VGNPYTEVFFTERDDSSLASARRVVPIVVDLVRPKSVVDVGCGHGTWLAAFQECGLTDLTGIDGPWVKTQDLLVEATKYLSYDLAQPFAIERRFDLAVSLEVAEHLPPTSAASFVDSLVRLAPVVLFAAAIPGQGGVMHVNEQWPGYWAALFEERGYVAIDAIRPRIWDIDEVEWWYAQNVLLFVNSSRFADQVRRRANSIASQRVMAVVHPRLYDSLRRAHAEETLRQLCRRIPFALRRSIGWHVLRRR
jgi:SAM-dependent methyltransferase